ncbi:unnamed protein product [Schistosoma rodhaini]|uniref:Uncharacterized protein n=1 Tax=Schistosoma rodhaini TaxID=6188 RepID=A0AA85EQ66_9TREM|nr:unnamed protein product [Schistosoma rodhaini]
MMPDGNGFSKFLNTGFWLFIYQLERLEGIDLMFCIQEMFGNCTVYSCSFFCSKAHAQKSKICPLFCSPNVGALLSHLQPFMSLTSCS